MLLVPFAGEGSGTAELTWGQQTVWRGVLARGAAQWLTGVRELADGTTVTDVADFLAFLVSRHQSLRTKLLLPDDGPVQQVVHTSGEIELDVVDIDDDADPLAAAKSLEATWEYGPLDYENEWPVRIAVIRHRGVPAYRVMVIHHTVADGFGVNAMLADAAARDPVTGEPSGPVTAMQPLEEARWQASPAGKRRSMMAEQYWERLLRTVPARRFPEPADKPEPRYGRASFDSPAAYLALQVVAARTGVDTSPVLLAAFAVGLARATGINPSVPRVFVSNRFRPRLGDAVSPISQTCPCAIDVAGVTFDEAVRRGYYASLSAFKNAYFEPVKIRELLALVSAERGDAIDLNTVYNDRRIVSPREADEMLPSPATVRDALLKTTLSWEEREEPEDLCHIHVLDSPDTVNVFVAYDSHYAARAAVDGFLRGMESVLVEAAFDPLAPTGV